MTKISKIMSLTVAVAALCLLAGCSADETTDGGQAGGLDILFSTAGVGGEKAATRADASDTYNSALPAGTDIGVYIYDSDGIDICTLQPLDKTSKTWVYRTVGAADASTRKSVLSLTSHTQNPRFPVKSGTSEYKDYVEIFAVFPIKEGFTPSTMPESYTFSVSDDQTVAANIVASDLLASDIAQYTAEQCEQVLDLVLRHRMAKVLVTLTPKSGSDLTSENIPGTFDVLNVYRTLTVTPKTGTVSDGNADLTTEAAPLKGSTSESFFIPPQTVTAGTTLLKFDILPSGDAFKGIEGVTFKPAASVSFEAGKVYHVNVTVDVDLATLTGTITSWTNENLPFDPRVL